MNFGFCAQQMAHRNPTSETSRSMLNISSTMGEYIERKHGREEGKETQSSSRPRGHPTGQRTKENRQAWSDTDDSHAAAASEKAETSQEEQVPIAPEAEEGPTKSRAWPSK